MFKIILLLVLSVIMVGCHDEKMDYQTVCTISDSKQQIDNSESEYQKRFEQYNNENYDVVGIVCIENTKLDFPIMNSDKYIYAGLDGKYLWDGLPFIENNSIDDDNLIIYGHNSRYNNSSCFITLKNYIDDENYIVNHPVITTYLKDYGLIQWRIFAVCLIPYNIDGFRYYHYDHFENENDYNVFISFINKYNLYPLLNNVSEYGDELLMLSTCSNNKKYGYNPKTRILIVCKKSSDTDGFFREDL